METLQKKKSRTIDAGVTEITITLPNKVIDKLESRCIDRGRRLEEFAAETIERALGKEVPLKDRFFETRHWAIPKSTFIITALPYEEWIKLWKWNDALDQVNIYPVSNGEVLVLNETRLGKWRAQKAQKTKPKA